MKLLSDQNLSPRLVDLLEDVFPDSVHVYELGLDKEDDIVIWEYARKNDFIIATKDIDFDELGLALGFPPKVVWIRRGNCPTRDIGDILRKNLDSIKEMMDNESIGSLLLY